MAGILARGWERLLGTLPKGPEYQCDPHTMKHFR